MSLLSHIAARTRVSAVLVGLPLLGCHAAVAAEAERIADVMSLAPGMLVADVGAGDGQWAEELARRVGAGGRVYATEVDADELAKITRRVQQAGLDNVTTVLGDQDRTGLPQGCCDAILLRLVYHHFTKPELMKAELRRALRGGGRLAVIDTVPQRSWRELPGVPDRGGHGIPVEELIAEMEAGGFELLEKHDRWNGDGDRYCVVFRAKP